MNKLLAGAAFFLISGAVCAPAALPAPEGTRAEYERMAAELPYLSLHVVLWRHSRESGREADPLDTATFYRVFARLSDGTDRKEDLLALLAHPDPKVRTLAAMALFERQDPSVLPALAALVDDKAATFDEIGLLSADGARGPGEPQTVGFLAEKMVRFYLYPAGFDFGVKYPGRPGFAEYWAARKDRAFCASWFAVQMKQATGEISPQAAARLPGVAAARLLRVAAVRRRVEALPGDEPAWLFLWLDAQTYWSDFATEAERVAAGRKLGPDKLLLMLQGRIPSDDPDLQARSIPMQEFVLGHAAELLRPQDSAALLSCEADWKRNGDIRWSDSAWWAVGAARLDTAHAPAILRAGLERFARYYEQDDRVLLRTTLWQMCGRSELGFVLDGFYGEQVPMIGPSPGASFIEMVGEGPQGREMLAAMIRDRRSDDLDWESLEKLVRTVNAWTPAPVVPEEELRQARHPFLPGQYAAYRAEAAREYPKESAELEAHLAQWRTALRRSVDQWGGETPGR